MKHLILAFAAFVSLQNLAAQDVTYVLFNRSCMNQLEYRYSYPNLKGDDAVWAYSVKPNVQEHYIFMTKGAGVYSPELPEGTITCRNLDLDDAFAMAINKGNQQMNIVFQRQSGGYWLMPVESATLIARKGARYWVRARQSAFQFDTLRLVNEQNLAAAGSPTAAYFSGAKLNNCLTEYSFHCEPPKSGQMRSDFQFVPNIGIVNDRTGNSATQAMENELQLVRVNGMALDDYIEEACLEGPGKIKMSRAQRPAAYGDERFEADKEISSIMQKEQEADQTPAEYSTDSGDCEEEWEPGSHIVQKGENLRAIARTYKVSEQNIIKWNKITNPDRIEICQKLWLKPPPAKSAKSVRPQAYDAQADEAGKTVRVQGKPKGQKGIAQKKAPEKSYDPNRPLEYSDSAIDENDYMYVDDDVRPSKKKVRIHTVHRGEYLYKIAKMYGCPEECIRIANGMSLEGDEPLSIGQELIIPECTCTVNGKVIRPTSVEEPAARPSTTVKKQGPSNSSAESRKKTRSSILDESEVPAEYNYDDELPVQETRPKRKKDVDLYEESSLYDDETSRTNTKKNPNAKSKDNSSKVQLFKEHHVKQGETLNSIATKYKVSASELSQVNGLAPKESLTPGKLILVPIDGGDDEDDDSGNQKKPTPSAYLNEPLSPASYEMPTTQKSPKKLTMAKAMKKASPSEYSQESKGTDKEEWDTSYFEDDTGAPTSGAPSRRKTAQKKTNSVSASLADRPRMPSGSEKPQRKSAPFTIDPIDTNQTDFLTEKSVTPIAYSPAEESVFDFGDKEQVEDPLKPKFKYYLVKTGDTLYSIAQKHKVDSSDIMKANKMQSDRIVAGRSIKIPVSAQ